MSSSGLAPFVYTVFQSPFGQLLLVSSDVGVYRVAFEREGFDQVLLQLTEESGQSPIEDDDFFSNVTEQLEEYFAGTRREFDVDLAFPGPQDLVALRSQSVVSDAHPEKLSFQKRGQLGLTDIGYGQTRSYREHAAALGNEKASRAAGSACSRNPLPIFFPCHRVLPTDRKVGDYRGGAAMKQSLLKLEDVIVDLKQGAA